jgi:MFS family permease
MLNRKSRLLLYGADLSAFSEGMFGPFLAIFTERIGGSLLDIAWAWAIYLIVSGALIMVIGRWSDYKKRKEYFNIAGFGLEALFIFGYLLVSSPLHLFIVQAGLGVAAALSIPTWDALYAKYEDHRHAGRSWGLVDGQMQMFSGVAIIMGGSLVGYFSFTALFLTMGIIQTIATFYQILLLRKR